MEKIDHIGIAVRDLEKSIETYERLLGRSCYKREFIESQGVHVAFFRIGESKLELLQSDQPGGVIGRYVECYGEGVHHLAYQVGDIQQQIERMKGEGFQALSEKPYRGADDKWVCFLHPKQFSGVLTELVQPIVSSDPE